MRISAAEAIKRLLEGEIVALPTDTVYGVGANFRDLVAVEALYSLKGRDVAKPLILLAADLREIESFLLFIPHGFYEMAADYWPGALTLVLPVDTSRIPGRVRADLLNCGFRIPDHPLALEVLRKTGPLAVTSANLSGGASCTSAEEVEAAFGHKLPLLNGGPCLDGVASTILAYDQKNWKLIRQGSVVIPSHLLA
ncbi:MAG: threonylcarbamoyl-AMP synthase [Verrucomicrobia bacterium]|nr:threonylcarbamoyl-AMP synthase [Verrucomicrobiota bacterium]